MVHLSGRHAKLFGGTGIESASPDDGLDRFHNRPLRTTTLPTLGSRACEAIRAATEHGPTLIASAPRWLHDLSPLGPLRRTPPSGRTSALDGDILVSASFQLVRTLMENDLVDELRLNLPGRARGW